MLAKAVDSASDEELGRAQDKAKAFVSVVSTLARGDAGNGDRWSYGDATFDRMVAIRASWRRSRPSSPRSAEPAATVSTSRIEATASTGATTTLAVAVDAQIGTPPHRAGAQGSYQAGPPFRWRPVTAPR